MDRSDSNGGGSDNNNVHESSDLDLSEKSNTRVPQEVQLLLHQSDCDTKAKGDDVAAMLDKEYNYVKFPPRSMVHEYSYPMIGDSTTKSSSSASSNLSTSMTKQLSSSSPRLTSTSVGLKKQFSTTTTTDKSTTTGHLQLCGSSSISSTPSPPSFALHTDDKMKQQQKSRHHYLSSSPHLGKRSLFTPSPDVSNVLVAELGAFGGIQPQCVHCRESFSLSANGRGSCPDAPCSAKAGIETVTGVRCAKGLLYHFTADSDGEYTHPCACSNQDGHCFRRWCGMTLLSFLLPCLCCYPPLMACYRCGRCCGLCGGKHQATTS